MSIALIRHRFTLRHGVHARLVALRRAPPRLLSIGVVLSGCTMFGSAHAVSHDRERAIAVVGVSVIPMDRQRVLEKQTVLIEDGRIAALGAQSTVSVRRGATRIDGAGRFLMPGLADMHVHVAREGGTPAEQRELGRQELFLFLATGVTLVRNMHGEDDVHLPLREEARSGAILSPRFYTTGPILEGENGNGGRRRVIATPAAAQAEVAREAVLGYDAVKVYNELTPEVYQAIVAAAAKYHLPVVGHVPFTSRLQGALEAHQQTIEHVNGYDVDQADPAVLRNNLGRNLERYQALLKLTPQRLAAMAQATLVAGVGNVPTLVVTKFIADAHARDALAKDARFRFLPPSVRKQQATSFDNMFPPALQDAIGATLYKRKEIVKALSDAGAPIMTGTDTMVAYLVPGFTVIDEIQLLIDAGLSPYQALRAATVIPARFVGLGDVGGTIEVGNNADLILLKGNPLEDPGALWKLDGVMIGGRWLSRQTLDVRLEALAASYHDGGEERSPSHENPSTFSARE